jgi:broad specificity phosphatase PhoE
MISVVLIRHGPTEWNLKGRIQGHTDVSLSEAGRAEVSRWAVPSAWHEHDWVASPLRRAMETARLLGAREVQQEPRLMELNWGRWEGYTWDELHAAHGPALADMLETHGLDFEPPAGESRRALMQRLQGWLADVGARARPVAAVTHRGIIHAALALATGWDMRGRAPERLQWSSAHLFALRHDGQFVIDQLNLELKPQ